MDHVTNLDDVVAIRRRLHTHPELGFCEFRTAEFLVTELTRLGFTVAVGAEVMDTTHMMGVPDDVDHEWRLARTHAANVAIIDRMRGGLTGIVATLSGGLPGRTVALRADMDALPISESYSADHVPRAHGYASERTGTMHACGHDGHVALLLALAARLSGTRFAGTLKLIFQPAEEGLRGARSMAESGIVDDVDDLLCLHLGVGLPTGHASMSATGGLASRKLRATFTGTAAHAGLAPERGRSALLAAAAASLAVHSLSQDGSADTRVNVGSFDAPGSSNVIPPLATLRLEVRASTTSAADALSARVEGALHGSAATYGVVCDIDAVGGAPAVVCDDSLVARLMKMDPKIRYARVAPQLARLWQRRRVLAHRPSGRHGGAGTYMIIGADLTAGHHEPAFDIDENALLSGLNLIEHAFRTLGVSS